MLLYFRAQGLSRHHYFAQAGISGMHARTGVMCAIYSKLLRVNSNTTKGDIVTLVSVDTNRLMPLCGVLCALPVCTCLTAFIITSGSTT